MSCRMRFFRWCVLSITFARATILLAESPRAPGTSGEVPAGANCAEGAADGTLERENRGPAASRPIAPATRESNATVDAGVPWAKGAAVSQLLAGLAKRQSLDPREYIYYQPSRDPVTHATTCTAIICDSRMRTLRANGTEYNVAIQSAYSYCTDGIRGEQIVLFEPRGKILDRVQCSIGESPLGRQDLNVEIPHAPEADGARK